MPEIVSKNPVNDPTQKSVKNHSKFSPSKSFYATNLFGLNTPFFAMAGVPDDDISMRVSADVDTYTLKAPLMQPIKRNMDYFQLPFRCLMPHAAELIVTNPLQGDDVDADYVNAVLLPLGFNDFVSNFTSAFCLSLFDGPSNSFKPLTVSNLTYLFRLIQIGNLFFSSGSLAKYLGYSFDSLFRIVTSASSSDDNVQIHDFDWCVDSLLNGFHSFFVNGEYVTVSESEIVLNSDGSATSSLRRSLSVYLGPDMPVNQGPIGSSRICSLYEFFYLLVTEPYIYRVTSISGLGSSSFTFGDIFEQFDDSIHYIAPSSFSIHKPVNLLRLLAYQKASAEFYSSDKVDGVYSAQLWESNQLALAYTLLDEAGLDKSYLVNGVPVFYDSVTGHLLSNYSSLWQNLRDFVSSDSSNSLIAFAYCHNLFAFTRSMKYEDYLVGSKVRPLAVGDVSVGVDTGSNTIDVIDVTKKIQVQRFLNQVNRVGRKFSDYVKGIFGDKPMKDVHEPIFLGHVSDTFGAEETDNTGDRQWTQANSTTSKLRNNSSRFAFDVHCGEQSVIIGIVNYDIVRVYSTVTDRENFHIDRYDMFNPFMQFVGDQEVFQQEVDFAADEDEVFGYQMRYMEYKQKVDSCAGGFTGNTLPGYAAILDDSAFRDYAGSKHISSDFIRSNPVEMDQFYNILSGLSLRSRFHFITRFDCDVTARRPMAFAPSIL